MKEKLLRLTKDLTDEGFSVARMEVEAEDIVRIEFQNIALKLLVNETYAKIEPMNVSNEAFEKVKKIVSKLYELRQEIKSTTAPKDIFEELNAA